VHVNVPSFEHEVVPSERGELAGAEQEIRRGRVHPATMPVGHSSRCILARVSRPSWWDWELELTPHLEKRMEDRDFTEVDVRRMFEHATSVSADTVDGRFVVETVHRGARSHIIVEPDNELQCIVVVTAYRVEV
jgi:hypothetical protein